MWALAWACWCARNETMRSITVGLNLHKSDGLSFDGLTDSRWKYSFMSDDYKKSSDITVCPTAPDKTFGDSVAAGGFLSFLLLTASLVRFSSDKN
jgi:hypothetical protein